MSHESPSSPHHEPPFCPCHLLCPVPRPDGLFDFEGVDVTPRKLFAPNRFPYGVPEETHHYVMWYVGGVRPTDTVIDQDIMEGVVECAGVGMHFDYAWYENPKMSCGKVFHVQVFFTLFDSKD